MPIIPSENMRKSTRFLLWIPAKFTFGLGVIFCLLLAIFRNMESQAASPGPIHADMPFFVFLLAIFPAASGLFAMLDNYMEIWAGEIVLARYLRKLGTEAGPA